jgi:SagB-type dehydrogenase family enzyme
MEFSIMDVKIAETLVVFPRGQDVAVYNYLTKDTVACHASDLYWLTVAPEWTALQKIVDLHPHLPADAVKGAVESFVENGLFIGKGSAAERLEAEYAALWDLGPATGMFHFSSLDNAFVSLEESVAYQKTKALIEPSPELFWKNNAPCVDLAIYTTPHNGDVLSVMAARRSNREVEHAPVALADLARSLYAGLGITGFVQTETSVLPLKMTPSGGARNPFECFVWARNVEGLCPGLYHYSALQNTLEIITHDCSALPSELLTSQDWTDNMPVVIFLVAVLRRTTWKYSDPNAYRVVLIEAGHIAQNIMLACTEKKLTACPTAALNHSLISEFLGLHNLAEVPIYALLVGHPRPQDQSAFILNGNTLERKPLH